jgi:hypothetical protein
MTNPEEKKYYQRDIIRICKDRGWDAKEIEDFLNLYNHMAYGYTLQDVDQVEYAINGPVMKRLHPDMITEQWFT